MKKILSLFLILFLSSCTPDSPASPRETGTTTTVSQSTTSTTSAETTITALSDTTSASTATNNTTKYILQTLTNDTTTYFLGQEYSSDQFIQIGYDFGESYGGFFWNYVLGAGWDFDFDDTVPGDSYDFRRVRGSDFETYSEYLDKIHSLCADSYFDKTKNFVEIMTKNVDDKIYVGETFAYAPVISFIEITQVDVTGNDMLKFYGELLIYYGIGGAKTFADRTTNFSFELKSEDDIWKLNEASTYGGSPIDPNDIFVAMYMLKPQIYHY